MAEPTRTDFSNPRFRNLTTLNMPDKKLILVIGATGAQGIAVIDALLAPSANGEPSPYAIRALTRDPSSTRAQELQAKGAQLAKGECIPAVSHRDSN